MNDLLMSAIGPSKTRVGAGWLGGEGAGGGRAATGDEALTHGGAIAQRQQAGPGDRRAGRWAGGVNQSTYQSCTQ